MKKKTICILLIIIFMFVMIPNVFANEVTIKENEDVNYIDSDDSGTINVGDKISIGTESFYVLKYDESNSSISMLSEKLIDIANNLQSDNGSMVKYSDNNSVNYEESLVKTYINKYTKTLNENYHVETEGSLMDIDTLIELGGTENSSGSLTYYNLSNCPSWLYEFIFWIDGSVELNGYNYVRYVDSNYAMAHYAMPELSFGLRPVITISSSVLDNYIISTSNTANGEITISKNDNEIRITPVPNEGYKLSEITVKQGNQDIGLVPNADGTYSFSLDGILGDVNVSAIFEKLTYEIKVNPVTGAVITPNNTITVEYDGSQSYTIKANEGYKLTSILVNGIEKLSELKEDILTIENVRENTNIVVEIEKESNNNVVEVYDYFLPVQEALANGNIEKLKSAVNNMEEKIDIFNELSEEEMEQLAALLDVENGKEAFFVILSDWVDANVLVIVYDAYTAYLEDSNKETATAFIELIDGYDEMYEDRTILRTFFSDIDNDYKVANELLNETNEKDETTADDNNTVDNPSNNNNTNINNGTSNDSASGGNNPQTSDNIILFIITLGIAIIGIIFTTKIRKKLKNNF